MVWFKRAPARTCLTTLSRATGTRQVCFRPLFLVPVGIAGFPLPFRRRAGAVTARSLSARLLFLLNLFLFVPFFMPAMLLMVAALVVAADQVEDLPGNG